MLLYGYSLYKYSSLKVFKLVGFYIWILWLLHKPQVIINFLIYFYSSLIFAIYILSYALILLVQY